jgi:ankyrin repeat protein
MHQPSRREIQSLINQKKKFYGELLLGSACPEEQLWRACQDKEYFEKCVSPPTFKCSQAEFVEFIIQANKHQPNQININAQNGAEKLFTALTYACLAGSNEVVSLLLKHGASPLISDNRGHTPFVYAVLRLPDSKPACRYLLKAGANINEKDQDGLSPLMHACRLEKLDSVSFLLMYGAVVDQVDDNGNTALMKVAGLTLPRGLQIVHRLLRQNASLTRTNNDGWNAMMFAAFAGNDDIVQIFLDNGSPVNQKSISDWTTALFWSANNGHTRCCELLLRCTYEPAHRNCRRKSDQQTPLIRAAEKGHKQCIKVLLKNGAHSLLRDARGMDALTIVSQKPDFSCIKPFLQRYVQQEKECIAKGDLRDRMRYEYGPIRGHWDADLLYVEISPEKRVYRRALSTSQRPFLRSFLLAWRSYGISQHLQRVLCRRNMEKNVERDHILVRQRCQRFLRAFHKYIVHRKRIKLLHAKDMHERRREILSNAKKIVWSIRGKNLVRRMMNRWKKRLSRTRLARMYLSRRGNDVEKYESLKLAWHSWLYYHRRLAEGKIFMRLSQYPALRYRLKCWKVVARLIGKETSLLFQIVAKWQRIARREQNRALKFFAFKKWAFPLVQMAERIRRLTMSSIGRASWLMWRLHHGKHQAARRIQSLWRRLESQKKNRRLVQIKHAKKKRIQKVLSCFESVSSRSNSTAMSSLLTTMKEQFKNKTLKEKVSKADMILYFSNSGIALSESELCELLAIEKLPCDGSNKDSCVYSIEAFVGWIILVFTRVPRYFDSKMHIARAKCSPYHVYAS